MEPETTTQRADRAVTEEGRAAAGRIAEARAERDAQSSFTAPSVTSIEAPQQPVVTPENTSFGVDMPTFSFLQPSAQEQALEQNVANIRNANTKVGQDLYSQMLGLGTQEGTQAQFEQELGVGAVSTRKSELESEILATQQKHLLKKEEILKGSGLSQGQKGAVLSEIERKQAIEATDLEIRYQAVTSSLNNLSSIAKRKADIVFGDKKAKVDALQFIYDENKEVLTDEENKLFQRSLMREKTALDMQVSKYAQFEEEKLKYVSNAAQAGADNNTLKAIQAAQSLDELYAMEGIQKFAMSQAEKLSVALQSENLANVREERQARADAAAARQAAIEAGEILPEQAETIDGIDSQFRSEPVVKEYNVAVAKKAGVDAVINSGVKGVEDIALVYEFMKSIDPTSVVRETEFATAANAGNIFQGKMAQFNGYFKEGGGSLPENVGTAFRNSINQSFAQKESQYYNVKDQFGEKVNRRLGIDNGSTYLTQYDAATSLQIDESGNIVIPGRQENADFFNPQN